ncbi:hypothetical protein LCGC14_0936100 [marine sediment metagenome]|uniref:S1 motif domain-containing protein n=1 Tax=marine sediment metagenome TaxID=412755 RepID=A0A0F9P7K7_9ZZZZ
MAKDLDCSVADLISNSALCEKIKLEDYVTDTVGLPTLMDIKAELSKPGRDPRKQFELFSFAEGINAIGDLEVGMELPGIVTNITAFGAFVDVGIHQDGLVHISQLSDSFVKNPLDIVKVHQKVIVTVLSVDIARKRISMSMKKGDILINEAFIITFSSIFQNLSRTRYCPNTQTIIDAPHKDLRRARSCGSSLIPTTTGSATAITEIFPELKGRLNGHAVRVPLTNASLTDCVFEVEQVTTVDEVNRLLKDAADNELNGILGFEQRPLVSIDYKGDPRSSIIDALSTMVVNNTQVKIYAWYDNEWGYANRTVELVRLVGRQDME